MGFQFVEPEQLYSKDPLLEKADVNILHEWVKKQPHLPEVTETQLILVLFSCYYNIEAAKRTVENYFLIKNICPEISKPMPKDILEKTARVAYVGYFPINTPKDYRIIFMKLLDCKAENFNFANSLNLIYMVAGLGFHQHGLNPGVVVILDMDGFSLGHLAKVSLQLLKHGFFFLQEASLVRMKEVHVINAIPLAEKILNLVKPLLKVGILRMLHFHTVNSETFYDYLPKEYLPEDYGGSLPSLEVLNEQHLENMLDNYDFFLWHDSQNADESKRVEKSKYLNEIFGVDGTFKKLEID